MSWLGTSVTGTVNNHPVPRSMTPGPLSPSILPGGPQPVILEHVHIHGPPHQVAVAVALLPLGVPLLCLHLASNLLCSYDRWSTAHHGNPSPIWAWYDRYCPNTSWWSAYSTASYGDGTITPSIGVLQSYSRVLKSITSCSVLCRLTLLRLQSLQAWFRACTCWWTDANANAIYYSYWTHAISIISKILMDTIL